VLHLDRHRRFGHPSLVAYIRRLAVAAKRAKLPPLLIGDLSQPRGGPTPTGHRSHQSGLDVDIGFTAFPFMARRKLTSVERETLFPPAVVDLRTGSFTSAYNPGVERLIALAAKDPAVNRIFVHPAVKRQLCATPAPRRPPWLRLVRPWWGHHDHLHVRLSCPAASTDCKPQDPLPPGDGCGELAWWFSREASKSRTARTEIESAEPKLPAPMPASCEQLLSASSS
jgi:penicillin-insensitive murein endopeptidase